MHGDFRRLVHPGTAADDIDVDGTRDERRQINSAVRAQQLVERLSDDPSVPTSPIRLERAQPTMSPSTSTVTGEGYDLLLAGIQLLLELLCRETTSTTP